RDMTIAEFLSFLDGVRSGGPDKWTSRCPAHPDKHPSLSVMKGDRGILLKCWVGCTLQEIVSKLGFRVSDLFYDAGVPDQAALQKMRHERVRQHAAKRDAHIAVGRRMDTLREAEYVVRSAIGIPIEGWSHAKLNATLNMLADAHERLWEESHEWR